MSYFSPKYNFSFKYPLGWKLGDNHLGYGTFQLFNSATSSEGVSIHKYNKIEASIGDALNYGKSDVYFEQGRDQKIVNVANQNFSREQIRLSGFDILSYSIPIPRLNGKYLHISIYGNITNFYILDQIVQTLKWSNQD